MILTTAELDWVDDQMKACKIKYQEIYDEILDHIITAIEEKRKNGDHQSIQLLFQQVIDTHFGGYDDVEDMATEQAKIYCVKVEKLKMQSFKHYLSWPVLAFIIIVLVLSFKIPDNKLIEGVLRTACTILAISPFFYATTSLWGKIKTSKGKQSILKTQIMVQSTLLIAFYNLLINIPKYFIPGDGGYHWDIFNHLPVPALILIVFVFTWLNLATIRFCKEMIATKSWYIANIR
ncbi:MAG: hypothetical protein JWR38_1442 [Mucilaginibacter sp.]|nr:hypothetical protein [Mucilaginibacter sp.]